MKWSLTFVATILGLALAAPALTQTPTDHLQCYKVADPTKLKGILDIDSPQLGLTTGCKISNAKLFCVPASKTVRETSGRVLPVGGQTLSDDRVCYKIKCPKPFPPDQEVTDQFGNRVLGKLKPTIICTPAVKGPPPSTTTTTTLPRCRDATDCPPGTNCVAFGVRGDAFAEFAAEYRSLCLPWTGSAIPCAANAECPSGQRCAPYLAFVGGAQPVVVKGACQALPNRGGAPIGASCSTAAACASGNCLLNPLTGRGYCTDHCLGGDADCGAGSGTACRLVIFNSLDPSTPTDDLRAGLCVQTTVGSPCFAHPTCKSCTASSECAPPQGIECVIPIGATVGTCRDLLGRCVDPCRHDCTPAGGGCRMGTTCTAVSVDGRTAYVCLDAAGECVRGNLERVFVYEHGMCGDSEYPLGGGGPAAQQDLCYYFGRQTGTDLFVCGQGCMMGSNSCSPIAITLAGGCPTTTTLPSSIQTTCRTVYEFGSTESGNGVIGGKALSPTQCAPASAFVGNPPTTTTTTTMP